MLIEHIDVNRHKGLGQWIKLVFVAAISFFGTAFTIMAFHNDISINKIFSQVYEQVMGYPADGYSILEFSYSIGLAVGIILFLTISAAGALQKTPLPLKWRCVYTRRM